MIRRFDTFMYRIGYRIGWMLAGYWRPPEGFESEDR